MSMYEKIASGVIGILVLGMIVFSFHEFAEPQSGGESQLLSDFDKSKGQHFVIGPFHAVLEQQSSGGLEEGCEVLQPVVITVLHDIKERLEHMKSYIGVEDAFEVNESALQFFCNKSAEMTLGDDEGNTLLLQKIPFTRGVPPHATAADVGTDVRIDATVTPAGASTPSTSTTYGEVLIPDRYLDTFGE